MKKFCDVIIPIYNAYDATVNCIASVIKSTNLKEDRLILINDCSPDTRISQHINSIKEQYPDLNIVVIENEANKGFVGTVNVGMRYSDNDVLLLNSDTIVGNNWLEKMKTCAYSQPKIATVTALSNNATIASAPQGLMRNPIPEDITIDEYNDLLTKCAYRDYPELPTAHGFCVYIVRDVLNKVGLFDEKSFGRGYGEENDFSYRCLDYGYRHLLCDDVIVYHLESQSFSEERERVIDAHLKILEERYPTYTNFIGFWCSAYPLHHICKNIDLNLKLRKKRNVLVLIHEWDNIIGGTTIHVKDIINTLSDRYNFHILFPNGNSYILESHFDDEIIRTTFYTKILSSMRYNRFNVEYYTLIDNIVKAFAISYVHIHHMIGHYFDIGNVIEKHGLKAAITLHDFYSVCPSHNLLYCDEDYCMDLEHRDCENCLKTTGKAFNNIIDEWRSDWHDFLKKFSTVVVPSEDTKLKIQKIYNDIEITPIEHGVDNHKFNNVPKISRKLKVAFIGVICKHKGGEIMQKLVSTNHPDIEFHVFGKSEYDRLKRNAPGYFFHGPYERENLYKLLQKNNINVVCFLQICPETYSYTLNEAVSAGIPVLSIDLGAGAQRTKKYNLGWILPKNSSAKDIMNKLAEIKNNPDEYNKVLESVNNYKFKTVKQMAEEYNALYETGNEASVDYEALKQVVLNELKGSGVIFANNPMLDAILNSAKWRLVSKIKIPRIISRPAKKVLKGIKKLIKR